MVANAARIGAEVLGPGLRELAAKHDSSARSAASACSGPSNWSGTARRSRHWALRHGPAEARPPGPGLLPFIADNRIHVVPPANIELSDAQYGLAVIDAALAAFAH